MPVIEVTLAQGRSPEKIRALIDRLTNAAAEAIDAPIASVRVIVREVPKSHFAAGNVTLEERQQQHG